MFGEGGSLSAIFSQLVPLKREKYLLTVYIYKHHLLLGFEEESDLRKRLDLLKVPKKITQIRCEENCPRAKSGRELVKICISPVMSGDKTICTKFGVSTSLGSPAIPQNRCVKYMIFQQIMGTWVNVRLL